MFTPPPSPGPSPTVKPVSKDVPIPAPSLGEAKRRIGRRTRWAVVTIPIILILVTLSTRYITHPVIFDLFESGLPERWSDTGALHARHLDVRQSATSSGSKAANSTTPTSTSSTVAQTAQPLPTVPSSPPVLPTPFPQPFDETMSKNFTLSCLNFFNNMTSTTPFRTCRPFSLLLDSSAAMLEAQTNLSLTNSIVWGTCNAPQSEDQCQTNMNWFQSELQKQCGEDLEGGNANARTTLMALQAFSVMHDAACLVDPNTNAYCYLEAVRSTNPSDLYYYMIALGTPLPSTAKSSCSSCTRSLMASYLAELNAKGSGVSGLQLTYNKAAQQAITDCGSSYATLSGNSASRRADVSTSTLSFTLVVGVVLYFYA
ncbi:hypothetical protein DL96DRAFT_1462540 [Flagelloscypha sp. PMI_526]|nr:hypothetical protein DL96DRAFT_1462540 [Flagelloscypha sp. PMI_526]